MVDLLAEGLLDACSMMSLSTITSVKRGLVPDYGQLCQKNQVTPARLWKISIFRGKGGGARGRLTEIKCHD